MAKGVSACARKNKPIAVVDTPDHSAEDESIFRHGAPLDEQQLVVLFRAQGPGHVPARSKGQHQSDDLDLGHHASRHMVEVMAMQEP